MKVEHEMEENLERIRKRLKEKYGEEEHIRQIIKKSRSGDAQEICDILFGKTPGGLTRISHVFHGNYELVGTKSSVVGLACFANKEDMDKTSWGNVYA